MILWNSIFDSFKIPSLPIFKYQNGTCLIFNLQSHENSKLTHRSLFQQWTGGEKITSQIVNANQNFGFHYSALVFCQIVWLNRSKGKYRAKWPRKMPSTRNEKQFFWFFFFFFCLSMTKSKCVRRSQFWIDNRVIKSMCKCTKKLNKSAPNMRFQHHRFAQLFFVRYCFFFRPLSTILYSFPFFRFGFKFYSVSFLVEKYI